MSDYQFVIGGTGEAIRCHGESAHNIELLDQADLAALVGEESQMAAKIYLFQQVNDARFRVYGGIDNGRPWIKLVTEFIAFVDQADFWQRLDALAAVCGGTVEVFEEGHHLDQMGTKDPHDPVLAGRTLIDEGRPDADGFIWSTGPDHGRMERQVEVWWDVLSLESVDELKGLIQRLEEATAEAWKEAGVGVF